jgi:hypothetical protein
MLRLAKYRRKNKLPAWGVFEAADPASIRALTLAGDLSGMFRTSSMKQHPPPAETLVSTRESSHESLAPEMRVQGPACRRFGMLSVAAGRKSPASRLLQYETNSSPKTVRKQRRES